MKNKVLWLLAMPALTLIYCTDQQPKTHGSAGTVAPTRADGDRFYDVYTGDLPCTECDKIATKLWLYKAPADSIGSYRLQETFVKAKTGRDELVEDAGKFRIEQNMAGNTGAVMYHLSPEDPHRARMFLKINERELVSLAGNSKPNASDPRFILTKTGQEMLGDSLAVDTGQTNADH